jgi:CheY-like chemotaxis protein
MVKPTQAKKEFKDLKLLVVEDDQTSVRYLSELLEKECKEIIVASNGQEAIETAKNNPDVEVILMDIKMPVMDGYTATQKIREFNQQVVIIAQTAFAMKGDRQKALDAGCNEYITKPIDKDSLLEIIREHFA